MTTAIEIDSVRHRYGEREALCGVSLSIGRGEIYATASARDQAIAAVMASAPGATVDDLT